MRDVGQEQADAVALADAEPASPQATRSHAVERLGIAVFAAEEVDQRRLAAGARAVASNIAGSESGGNA